MYVCVSFSLHSFVLKTVSFIPFYFCSNDIKREKINIYLKQQQQLQVANTNKQNPVHTTQTHTAKG